MASFHKMIALGVDRENERQQQIMANGTLSELILSFLFCNISQWDHSLNEENGSPRSIEYSVDPFCVQALLSGKPILGSGSSGHKEGNGEHAYYILLHRRVRSIGDTARITNPPLVVSQLYHSIG